MIGRAPTVALFQGQNFHCINAEFYIGVKPAGTKKRCDLYRCLTCAMITNLMLAAAAANRPFTQLATLITVSSFIGACRHLQEKPMDLFAAGFVNQQCID